MNFHAEYINLDHRHDRLEHMKAELSRVSIEATRFRGIPWKEVEQPVEKIKRMLDRTPGAIGCHYSQVGVMENALAKGEHALVMEDDLIFCSDFWERMRIVEEFLSTHEWDVFWLGGTYHLRPTWHQIINGKHTHPDLPNCTCENGVDWEKTDNPRIRRTFGCWSTYAYIVNIDSLPKVLEMLDANVHKYGGIDWLFISLEPDLHTYCFYPGMAKQMDSLSDIGTDGDGNPAMTVFSNSKTLGPHWFKDRI